MTRTAAVGASLAVAAVVIMFALAHVFTSSGPAAAPPPRALMILTSLAPREIFFGDRVTARAEVLVDRRRVDPDAVRVETDFAPFAIVGSTRASRSDAGKLTSLGYRFVLECVSDKCLPQASMLAVTLPALRVRAPVHGGGRTVAAATWRSVQIVGRVSDSEASIAPTPWRVQLALPTVSYRMSPTTLSRLLIALAAVLAAAALWLAAWEVARLRGLLREREEARTRLERVLELVRESLARDVDDRRKALAALARELDGDGRLSFTVERLAWARAEPSVPNIEAVVNEVEQGMAR